MSRVSEDLADLPVPGTHYIGEVQGLRAVAVAGVLVFHVGLPLLPGGFVGVDVFFVISGFVITLLIRRQLEQGSFSFRTFYLRRAKRLLPALLVVLVLTGAVNSLLSPAVVNGTLLPSLLTATFGVSNFYFREVIDYFDSGVSNPVLHTWSLGVEEQFYLGFPALLVLLARSPSTAKPARLLIALGAWASLSLLAAVLTTTTDARSAFYLPWLRAWEFLCGAMVAVVERARISRLPRAHLSMIGSAVLFASLFFYKDSYVFPGLGALLPVAGTVLLIAGFGHDNPVNRCLSSRWLQAVGDASYSLYLVHWPVICLVGMFLSLSHLRPQLFALALSGGAGYLLWRGIELPLRAERRAARTANRPLRWLLPLALCGVPALLVAEGWLGDAMWKRYPGALRYFTATTDTTALLRTGSCFLTPKSGFENFDSARCLHWEPGQPRLLVQGDSLAANLARALQKRYADYAVMQATAALYSPGHSDRWPAYAASLDRFIDAQLLTPPPRIERAVLFALWQPDDLLPLTAYVDRLKALGVKVTVIGPSPQFYLSVPLILAYSEMTGIEMVSRFEKAERRQLDRQFAAQLASRVQYVSLFDILCADPDGKPAPCRVREGDDALFVDREHLTEAGSKALVGRFPAF